MRRKPQTRSSRPWRKATSTAKRHNAICDEAGTCGTCLILLAQKNGSQRSHFSFQRVRCLPAVPLLLGYCRVTPCRTLRTSDAVRAPATLSLFDDDVRTPTFFDHDAFVTPCPRRHLYIYGLR